MPHDYDQHFARVVLHVSLQYALDKRYPGPCSSFGRGCSILAVSRPVRPIMPRQHTEAAQYSI